MEFISVINPIDKRAASSGSSRRVHSHAAKTAHARSRRLRMVQFMNQKSDEESTSPRRHNTSSVFESRERNKWMLLAHRSGMAQMLPKSIDGAFEPEPLAGFLSTLTAKEHFLFNHYVQVVLPGLYSYCSTMNRLYHLSHTIWSNWVLIASTEIEMLQGFLLTACRHLSQSSSDREFSELAIQYKLRHLQSLRETMSAEDPSARRIAVTKALVLATDDTMNRDLPSASQHVLGALRIIQASGGARALGLSDVVRSLLHSQIHGKGLLGATEHASDVLLI